MTSLYRATSTTKKVFTGLYLSDKRVLVTAVSSEGDVLSVPFLSSKAIWTSAPSILLVGGSLGRASTTQ